MPRRAECGEGGRTVEFEFRLGHLVGLLVLVAALVLSFALYWRAERRRPAAPPAAPAAVAPKSPGPVEDVGAQGNVFDRGGAESLDRSRQVTREAGGSGLELDLGDYTLRDAAERVRAAAKSAGFEANVVIVPGTTARFRVVAGPFANRAEADRAAGTLGRILGRPVKPR